MNRYDIVIDKISSDRQHCIDSHGKKYSIANIEELSKHQSLNVYTRKNTSGNKYSKIIVHKPRCNPKTLKVRLKSNGGKVLEIKQSDVMKKGTLTGNGVVIEQKDIIRNNTYKDNTVTISEHKYNMASKISKELYVVTEDRGTTINIIAQILRLFAYDKNINLKCTYLGCHGNSYMSAVLLKYIPQNSLCIVIYDTGLSKDQYIEHEIGSTLKKVKNRLGVKIVKFTPYCIEECALTFKYLTNEIIGLDTWQKKLLECANQYIQTGNINNFIMYDKNTSKYTVAGKQINFGYPPKAARYPKIDSIERYLTDELAGITCGKPYYFNKSVYVCWYNNCATHNSNICALEKKFGTNRKDSPVSMCHRCLMDKNKIKCIIENSMFGLIYEAANKLIYNNYANILNSGVIKRLSYLG